VAKALSRIMGTAKGTVKQVFSEIRDLLASGAGGF
jgi:hypothetical protein